MTESHAVEVTRRLEATPAEVFRWWSEPRLIERWMSPRGSVEASVDLRVGGDLRIVMREGAFAIEHTGQYVEIDPPHRLVFTWESRYTQGPSLVTVSFAPLDGGATQVVISHSRLPAGAVESHSGGWGAMADRLYKELMSA